MQPNTPPQPDIISPAEAQFWADWAAKAPALLRAEIPAVEKADGQAGIFKIGAVLLGAVLGIATFTKHVPGKWKILSGAASGASLAASAVMGEFSSVAKQSNKFFLAAADDIEKNPALQQKLAIHLSHSVTADEVQKYGIEKAVAAHLAAAVLSTHFKDELSELGYVSSLSDKNKDCGCIKSR